MNAQRRRSTPHTGLVATALVGIGFACSSAIAPPAAFDWTPTPARAAPLTIGVQTHFGMKVEGSNYDPGQSTQSMRASGFATWRDNISFGRWALARSRAAVAVNTMGAFRTFAGGVGGGQAILNATGWPAGATGADRPAAFAKSLVAALPDYPAASLVEIWNEWDKDKTTPDNGSVQSYVALLSATLPVLRKAAPDRRIVVGAAADDQGGLDFSWTRALLQAPITRQASGISVHLYNHCAPRRYSRGAADMMARLDSLHDAMRAQGLGKMPVYVSEYGWPTGNGKCLVDPDIAAGNVAHFTLLAAARPWLAGTWLYELKDSGTKQADPESNFGIYDFAYKPKPGACAARFANQLVRGGTIVATHEADDITAVLYHGPNGVQTIAWATNANYPVTVKLTAATKVQPMCGTATTAGPGNYQVGFRPVTFAGDLLAAARGAGGTNTLR